MQFLCAFETNGPASATNRFLTSCAWQFLFNTEVPASFPILVVPTSWMIRPTGSSPYNASRDGIGESGVPPISSISSRKVCCMCRTWFSS